MSEHEDEEIEENKSPNLNKKRAYRETVRGKEKRKNLKGFSCFRCQEFYEAMNMQEQNFCNDCSKHRDNYKVPTTPPHFNELDC